MDCGLFWVGPDGRMHRADEVNDSVAPVFCRKRPTLLYLHGWEINRVSQGFRESFDYALTDPRSAPRARNLGATAADWLQAGWNVGVFYWDQWSDEPLVADAEAKIWTGRGPQGMRYRVGDGAFVLDDEHAADERSVGERVADALEAQFALEGALGTAGAPLGELRIAGHSLGSQLALNVAHILFTRARQGGARAPVPSRVALLDPHFPRKSPVNPQAWLTADIADALGGSSTVELNAVRLTELARSGVVFERYISSAIPDIPYVASVRPELTSAIPTVRFNVCWTGRFDLEAHHLACPAMYFASFGRGHADAGIFSRPGPPAVVPSAQVENAALATLLEASGLMTGRRELKASPAWKQLTRVPALRGREPLRFYEVDPLLGPFPTTPATILPF